MEYQECKTHTCESADTGMWLDELMEKEEEASHAEIQIVDVEPVKAWEHKTLALIMGCACFLPKSML